MQKDRFRDAKPHQRGMGGGGGEVRRGGLATGINSRSKDGFVHMCTKRINNGVDLGGGDIPGRNDLGADRDDDPNDRRRGL